MVKKKNQIPPKGGRRRKPRGPQTPATRKLTKRKPKGCALEIRIRDLGDSLRHSVFVGLGSPKSGRSLKRPLGRDSSAIAGTLAAAGHVARLRILDLLLAGPATYRALQRCTRCKVGPLYHHINHLRLAGLILPKERDLYDLTRGGRNVILCASALRTLAIDHRPRPI